MAKKVTMQQIADSLGVSKFVVSKALSGKGGVSEATKEKVIQAASDLGYFAQKNGYVKSLKFDPPTQPTNGSKQSVLVLMPNIRFQTKDSLYWGKILDGISARLEQAGLGIILISEQNTDSFLHILNPNGILGMIGVGEITTTLLLEIHRLGLPLVLVDHEEPLIPADSIFINNYDCSARLTKHLIALGHHRLGFVGNKRYSRSFYDRWLGFRAALEEQELSSGLEDESLLSLEGVELFHEQIKRWILNRNKAKSMATALVCANDRIAIEAMEVLSELGISVPDEVSVTGFDNIEVSALVKPALTTVHVPKELMGARAVEKLLERIGSKREHTEKLLISGESVYRDSAAEFKS
jgi:LacI family transcriptional regulator